MRFPTATLLSSCLTERTETLALRRAAHTVSGLGLFSDWVLLVLLTWRRMMWSGLAPQRHEAGQTPCQQVPSVITPNSKGARALFDIARISHLVHQQKVSGSKSEQRERTSVFSSGEPASNAEMSRPHVALKNTIILQTATPRLVELFRHASPVSTRRRALDGHILSVCVVSDCLFTFLFFEHLHNV